MECVLQGGRSLMLMQFSAGVLLSFKVLKDPILA